MNKLRNRRGTRLGILLSGALLTAAPALIAQAQDLPAEATYTLHTTQTWLNPNVRTPIGDGVSHRA